MTDAAPDGVSATEGACLDREIDELLAEHGGDAKAAIAALLHDLDVLAADAASSVSLGYIRGNVVLFRRRP